MKIICRRTKAFYKKLKIICRQRKAFYSIKKQISLEKMNNNKKLTKFLFMDSHGQCGKVFFDLSFCNTRIYIKFSQGGGCIGLGPGRRSLLLLGIVQLWVPSCCTCACTWSVCGIGRLVSLGQAPC